MSTQRVWRMMKPFETSFAEAGSRSPPQSVGPACQHCGASDRTIMPTPLVLEWEPGSQIIGDFVWPSPARVVAKRTVVDQLVREFNGIRAEPIEMVQDPKLKQPQRPNKRTKPRVWLPYPGPELVELWPEHTAQFLPSTTLYVGTRCDFCGRESHRLAGVEVKAHVYDREKGELVPDLQPRVPGQGVFVAASSIKNRPIFRAKEFTNAIWCTDEARSLIQSKGFTNVDFLEYGDVVDP